jgi:hypothetical protein
MFYVFAQYGDPWVLTVLIDGELWGGKGGIGKGADGQHRIHVAGAPDELRNLIAYILTLKDREYVSCRQSFYVVTSRLLPEAAG